MHYMTALTSAVLALLCLSIQAAQVQVNSDDHKSDCTTFNESDLTRIIGATTLEAQINLTASIIADILPDFGPIITIGVVRPGTATPLPSTRPDSILRDIYAILAKHYDQKVTEGGYRQFLEATNEISVAKEEACRNASGIVSESLQLIQEFVDAYKMKDQNSHPLRPIYGKLLCLNSTINSNSSQLSRKRRDTYGDECACPPDGFDSDFTFCHFCDFYACMTDVVFGDIFFPPGSMWQEISIAKDTILNFTLNEQEIGIDGCYMLVEFNDVGPNNETVPEDSVSNITYANSFDALDLSNFYNRVINIRANWINNRYSHGGDGPEYALYAMKKALTAKDHEDFTLMKNGSQMVVLTDAPSKQPELKDDVIQYALSEGVCIHFFVNHPDYSLEDGIYEEIAEETYGTLISSYTQWDIASFVAKYKENGGCEFVQVDEDRKQRSTSLFFCKNVTVSRLAANLRLSINAPTGSGLTIRQPNGICHELRVHRNNLTFFNQTNPENGSWSICSTGGYSINVADVVTYLIDTTVFYWNSNIASVLPPACPAGKIVIISSKHDSIGSATLEIVEARSRNIAIRAVLTKGCDGAFVSNKVNFPNGSYTYHLVGTDIDGVPFKYNTRRAVTYKWPDVEEFSFTPIGELAVEMDRDQMTTLEFNFTNRWAYDTNFDFSVNAPEGLVASIEPSDALVAAGTTIKIQVLVHVNPRDWATNCKLGTLYRVNVIARVSCTDQQIQAPIRSVIIVSYQRLEEEYEKFMFEPIENLAAEMDRDEIMKLEFNFTNKGTHNTNFNFTVNIPEGFATRIEPSNAVVAASTTIKIQVLLRVIHSSIKQGTLHTVNVIAMVSCTEQQIQAPVRSVVIRKLLDYTDNCGECDGACLKTTYLGGNFRRCHGSGNFPSPLCPVQREQIDDWKIIYFMEGAQLASFDPPPACTFGRIGLALTSSVDVKLLSTSIATPIKHIRYDLTMEEFCNGSHLVPAGSTGNFPNGEITYYFEYKLKSNEAKSYVRYRSVTFKQMSEPRLELASSESGITEIGTSENIRISFQLSNPTTFTTNFTVNGSFQSANGLEVDDSLLGSVVVYSQETVEIEATIKASSAPAGSSNVFTLNATNGCVELSAHRNITVVEQTTGSQVTQTEAPTPADECGGCQNGGTCTVRVRRGRVIRRCSCPSGFGGSYCQIAY